MGGWVFLAIVIGIAIISAISHVLKNQQQAAPPPRRRQSESRPQKRPESVRVASETEQDRFLAEIERLRKKATTAPSKAVPTVKPAKAKKQATIALRLDQLPAATIAKSHGRASETPSIPVDTPVIPDLPRIAPIATILDVVKPLDAGDVSAAKMITGKAKAPPPSTKFSRDLTALLSGKMTVPMAVVLHEILGEPKCRRH